MSEQVEKKAANTKTKYPTFSEQWAAAPSKPEFIVKLILVFVLIFSIGFLIVELLISPTPEEKAARAAGNAIKETKIREYGHQCLSGWDGSHGGAVAILKNDLRDPDSFQHIETLTSRANDAGYHRLTMRYRAKNGFGGFTVSTVTGYFRADNCLFTGIF